MRILLFIACVCAATSTGVEVSGECTSDNVDLLQSAKHSSLTGSTWHTIAAAVSTMRNDPSAKRARHSPEMEGLEASMSQLAGNVISGREEMTKGIKDIADAVRAEMSKIVAEVENGEKQALQDQINAGVAAFDECAAPATIDDNFETAANSKEKAHSDCRTEEKRLKGVAANKANTYDDEFPASPPSCNSNFAATYATPATMEQISTFTECVQKTADWWSAYKSSAIPAANAYKAAGTAHTDETAKCNTAQTTFETTYCSYAVHFEDTCGAYTRCYTAKSSAFQNMTKDVQTLEATHKRLFTSAKHITCLLNLLEDTSNTDKQTLLNDCLNEQIDTSSVEVTMKSAPEAADCHSVAGTVENPGGQGFATKFYNQKDWHDDAPTQAQIECVIPVSAVASAEAPTDATTWVLVGHDVCRGAGKSGVIRDYGDFNGQSDGVPTKEECKKKCEEDDTCKGIAWENPHSRCITTRDVSLVEHAGHWDCLEKKTGSTAGQTQCPDTWVNIEGKCYSPPEGTPVLVGKAGFPSGAANYCQNLDSSAQIMTREEAEAYLASPLGADKPCQSNNRDCGRPLGKQHGYTRTISGSSIWLTNYGFFHPHPSSLDRWFSCVKTID